MNPVKLRIEGFLSYKDPVEIDFSRIHVASITGANGSGKSSILDAITWVLFDEARAKYDSLINQRSDTANVQLDFDYEDQLYRVTRSRTRGKTGTLDFYIFDPVAQTWKTLNESTSRLTGERIQSVLRLDYATFVNASFFLQGKADQFTKQSSGDRKIILSRILGLEIWNEYLLITREKQKIRKNEFEQTSMLIKNLTEEISSEGKILEDYEQLKQQLKDKNALKVKQQAQIEQSKQFQFAREQELTKIELARKEVEQKKERIEKYKKNLTDLQQRLELTNNQLKDGESIEIDYNRWLELRDRLDEELEKSRRYQEINQQKQNILQNINLEATSLAQKSIFLAEEEQKVEQERLRYQEISPLYEKQTAERKLFGDLTGKKKALQEDSTRYQTEITALNSEISHLKAINDEKREKLINFRGYGSECPFCNQPLTDAHREKYEAMIKKDGLERKEIIIKREKEVEEKRSALQSANEALKKIDLEEKTVHKLDQEIQRNQFELEQIQKLISDWDENESPILADIDRALNEKLYERKYEQELAELEKKISMTGFNPQVFEELQTNEKGLRGIEEKYQAIIRAKEAKKPLIEQIENNLKDLSQEEELLGSKIDELTRMETSFEPLYGNIPDLNTLTDELNEIDIEINNINLRIGAIRQKLDTIKKKKSDLEANRLKYDALSVELSQFKQLDEAFGRNGVPALLIEQALPEIEASANELLERLTNSQYSIHFETQSDYKDKNRSDKKETLEILINDENGHSRQYELFSGGEAFRINFAIRLALSQVLTKRAGARLQTLIIDEGFGSQDQDGIYQLIDTIRTIEKDFSKILLITHLEEIKDEFSARIHVEKTPKGSKLEVFYY